MHQKKSVSGDIAIKLLNRGYKLDFCIPSLGEILPHNIDMYSLIVVFGGPISVNDNDDFITNEIRFMKLIIDSNIPYLGICLGAQFLAKYLGASIRKNDNNLSEIGFFNIYPSKDGKNLFKNQKIFYQFHSE